MMARRYDLFRTGMQKVAVVFGNKLVSSGAWLVVLFLTLGYSKGWASAARQCWALAYVISVLWLVIAMCTAASFQDVRTDRATKVSAALAITLGLTGYVLLGSRPLYLGSLFGVAMGAVVGVAIRFYLSSTNRSLDRRQHRLCGRVRKIILRFRG